MDGFKPRIHPFIRGQRLRRHLTVPAGASRRRATTALTAAAALLFANTAGMAQYDEVRVQGNWAYTQRGERNSIEHVATTPAADGNTWLVIACSGDQRLTVSLLHNMQFAFPFKASSSIQLRSKDVSSVSVEGRSADSRQIVLDPRLMRHVMPFMVQEDRITFSVREPEGLVHDYTFAMQPNDMALKGIRGECFKG